MSDAVRAFYDRESTDVTIRFKDVDDIERLRVDIELMLESLSEEGAIIDMDD